MTSRADHRRRTLSSLGEAAVALYDEMHPAEPTMDDIAARAGVSRRTAFRYVARKEDLAFTHPLRWLETFDAAMTDLADAPSTVRLRHGAAAICEVVDDDPDPVRRALLTVQRTPTLAVGYWRVNQLWIDRIDGELNRDDRSDPFRSRVLAAAVMGVIDAALAEWATDEGSSLAPLVERGLAILRPLLDPADPEPTPPGT